MNGKKERKKDKERKKQTNKHTQYEGMPDRLVVLMQYTMPLVVHTVFFGVPGTESLFMFLGLVEVQILKKSKTGPIS